MTGAAAAARPARRMPDLGGYYAALLSMAALDLLLSGLFVTMAGKPEALLARLPEVAVFLVALTLSGGWWLARPVARMLAGTGPQAAGLARLAVLGAWTGYWATAVSALFAVSAFLVTPFVIYGLPAEPAIIAVLAARAVAWVVLLPYLAYFLVHEQLRRLRLRLWRDHGLAAPPGCERIGVKLGMVVLGGAFVPGLSIALTIALVPPISPITGQPRDLVILVTLLGTGLALTAAFWAMHRSLADTFAGLTAGLDAMREGDLGPRLSIATDDELGRLADGFNALAVALRDSRTAARTAEAERLRESARFHEAQKQSALGRLAAGIAHDFNNILAIVMGYAATVRRKTEAGGPQHAMLGEVLGAAERGKDLIARIMAFVREGEAEAVVFDLAPVVAQSTGWLSTALEATATLETCLDPGPLPVRGDPTAMHQVLANLCTNAAQAGSARVSVELARTLIDGGRAEGLAARLEAGTQPIVLDLEDAQALRCYVGVLAPGPHARLSVIDRGVGIDARTLSHVFEPYFTTKPVGEGTGLGLAAVLGIVGQHHGAITLTTAPGRGTRFDVLLPLETPTPD